MFAPIARFDNRSRWPIVVVWSVGVVADAHHEVAARQPHVTRHSPQEAPASKRRTR